MFGDLEELVQQKHWRFGETCSVIWRNLFGKNVGDLEKRGRRFGETHSAKYVGDLEKRDWRFGGTRSVKYVGDLEKRDRRSYGDFVLEFVIE